jgi:hypothetical protein
MGAIIPTGPDAEICSALTDRFSERIVGNKSRIDHLRDHQTTKHERFFDANHHLHRLAHRFKGIPRGQRHKLRWFAFLRSVLHNQAPQTVVAIKSVLDACLADASIQRVEFHVTHDASIALPFELYPGNSGLPQISNAGGLKICTVTLVCRQDQELPDAPAESDPPAPDAGTEQPPEFPG